MKRILIYLILTAFFTGAVIAQDVSVRSDHPDEYTVVEGDTLWDISGRFLDYPWQWPAIWHANQQIENPHLIYPGDVVSLVYVDGSPRLMVDRGKPIVKMSPNARRTDRNAITAIPHGDIDGFLRNIRMVSPGDFEQLPYIIDNLQERINSVNTDRTYAIGLTGDLGERFAIVRLGHIYYETKDGKRAGIDPGYGNHAPPDQEYRHGKKYRFGKKGEVIGYELFEVSHATLVKKGNPAILEVEEGPDTIQKGDFVVPLDTLGYPAYYMPSALDPVPDGVTVLAVQGDNGLVGHQKILAISAGTRQGVKPGNVFSAFRPGQKVRDEYKYPKGSWADIKTWDGDKVVLPDEFQAYIMVFRVFEEISYALIMEGPSEVRVNDHVRHPEETL